MSPCLDFPNRCSCSPVWTFIDGPWVSQPKCSKSCDTVRMQSAIRIAISKITRDLTSDSAAILLRGSNQKIVQFKIAILEAFFDRDLGNFLALRALRFEFPCSPFRKFSLLISEDFWVFLCFFLYHPRNVLKIQRLLGKSRKGQKPSLISKERVTGHWRFAIFAIWSTLEKDSGATGRGATGLLGSEREICL